MSGEHIPFVWHLLQDIPLEEIGFFCFFSFLFIIDPDGEHSFSTRPRGTRDVSLSLDLYNWSMLVIAL